MKTTKLPILALLGASLLLPGCATNYSGWNSSPLQQESVIKLKENDFKVVKAHLTGTASCGYFLGIPIGDPRVLSSAHKEIAESSAGMTIGKPTQLVNWTLDQVWSNFFFLYRTHKVVLAADLIEFE